jgi:hypothetical protein
MTEVAPPPGSRVRVRGEEWAVERCLPLPMGGHAVYVQGLSELVPYHQAIFLTPLDTIVPDTPIAGARCGPAPPRPPERSTSAGRRPRASTCCGGCRTGGGYRKTRPTRDADGRCSAFAGAFRL